MGYKTPPWGPPPTTLEVFENVKPTPLPLSLFLKSHTIHNLSWTYYFFFSKNCCIFWACLRDLARNICTSSSYPFFQPYKKTTTMLHHILQVIRKIHSFRISNQFQCANLLTDLHRCFSFTEDSDSSTSIRRIMAMYFQPFDNRSWKTVVCKWGRIEFFKDRIRKDSPQLFSPYLDHSLRNELPNIPLFV